MGGNDFLFLLFLVHGISALTTSATFREFSAEDEEVLFQILSLKASEIKSVVESGRKILQRTRQWQESHPAESRLLHCVIRYCIDTKIPGLASTADGDNDGRRGLPLPIPIQELRVDPSDISQDVTEILANDVQELLLKSNAVKYKKYLFKRKVIKAVYLAYIQLRDLFSEYKLLGCSFQYLTSKFWEWVDSAP